VLLDGAARASLDRQILARRIGFLPQTSDVHWDIDVETLVSLGRFPHRGRWADDAKDRAAITDAMTATDTTTLVNRVVNTLSGGERGRALLARVLAGTPDWLLADEPLASLDPAHQIDVLDRLRAIAARGAGVVVVLHDLNQAARVADAVVLMRAGKIVAQGPADAVLTPALIGETYGVATEIIGSSAGNRLIVTTGRLDRGWHGNQSTNGDAGGNRCDSNGDAGPGQRR
jgi:iron complex transport system ATP-binding protein